MCGIHGRPLNQSGPARVSFWLLLVLVAGIGIMTFTHTWLATLPYHDHLGLSRAYGYTIQHMHPGDEFARAALAFRSLSPTTALSATAERVVSLAAIEAQGDPSSFTATGLTTALIFLVILLSAPLMMAERFTFVEWLPRPIAPPPRPN